MDDENRAPPISDPRWETWSGVLLAFLDRPRDWKALNGWCRETRFGAVKLRHCLAWLEIYSWARSFMQDDVIFWVSTRTLATLPIRSTEGPGSLPPGAPEPSIYEDDPEEDEPPPSEPPSMQN